MRWSLFTRAISALALVTSAAAAGSGAKADDTDVDKDAFGKPVVPSTFNGQEVPPFLELDGETLASTIEKGYWLVEFFSPYCAHCKRFAPTLQTFYELYYTSDPSLSTADAKKSDTFSTYYNFNFGKVNCAAFGTACSDHEVKNFPTIHVLKDGKLFKKSVGGKPLDEMTEWMEEVLEEIKPGTRPKGGLPLPKVGDDHVDADAPKASSKKKSKGKDTAKGEASDKKSKAEDVLPDDSDSKSKTKDKKKSGKKVPNSEGRSVALTAETFNTKVSGTRDPWFIKFYAPWCPHCQHMAPAWKSVGRDMEGKLNVGEVNCEVEKRFCKDVGIRGFPSLLYFQGGERMEYEGLRKVGDLLDFANKAVSAGGGVNDVSAAEFEELEKTEEVIFTYMYDHATTSEDFAALERLALPLIGRAKLVKTNDPKMFKRFKISTWPRLVVSRDGKPTYYTPLSPRDMRDKEKVLGWMHKNWQPIVPEITSANAEEIMAGKLVVLGILSRDRADEFVIAKREIKNAALEWIDKQTQAFQLERQELRDAKQLRIEEAEDRDDQRALRNAKGIRINMEDIERRQVQFAWVDGVFWERWIKVTYGISVKDGERVIVNDEENHRYWDTTITGNPIVPSRTSILETLPKIVANPPKLSPKSTASFFGHIYFSFRRAFRKHPFLTSGSLVLLVVAAVLYARGSRNRTAYHHVRGDSMSNVGTEKKGWGTTGGFFQLPLNGGGKEGSGGAFGGLLGNGQAVEKAD